MSKYKVGDKFEIEIEEILEGRVCEDDVIGEIMASKLYRIKGFNSLVFDDFGLDKLKKLEEYERNEEEFEFGDIVEISEGDFKGEKAFVIGYRGELIKVICGKQCLLCAPFVLKKI